MQVRNSSAPVEEADADMVAVSAGTAFKTELAELDRRFDGHLLPWLTARGFSGRTGTATSFPSLGRIKARELVIVGHGFGRLASTGITLEPAYDDAREALQRARATVFCLDVTQADYHSLEVGLQTVAEDTGGLYQRTHVFSQSALNRVVAALEGQYVLFVEKPALPPGSHRVKVRLKGRDGDVYAPATYVDEGRASLPGSR